MTKEETLAFLEENGGIDIECAKMQYEHMSDVYARVEDMIVDRIYGICRDKEVAKEVAKILIEKSEV